MTIKCEQVLAPSAGGFWFNNIPESQCCIQNKNVAKCVCLGLLHSFIDYCKLLSSDMTK